MKQKGFTLVELLVVISIIGLLSSIVLAATKVARTESRDAKRVADIREIATALDFFYTQNNAYPYVNEVGSWAVAWADLATCLKTGVGCVNNGTQNIAAYVPVLANLPQDPQFSAGTGLPTYYYNTYSTDPVCPGNTAYRLAVQLEATNAALQSTIPGGFYQSNHMCVAANKWYCIGVGQCNDFN